VHRVFDHRSQVPKICSEPGGAWGPLDLTPYNLRTPAQIPPAGSPDTPDPKSPKENSWPHLQKIPPERREDQNVTELQRTRSGPHRVHHSCCPHRCRDNG